MLPALLLLQAALSASAPTIEPPRPRLVAGVQVGGIFRVDEGNSHTRRMGFVTSGSLRLPRRTWGAEVLLDGIFFPRNTGIISAPCDPARPDACRSAPGGSRTALMGSIGIYARDETAPRTRVSYGIGAALSTTRQPGSSGPDPGGYVRLDYHPPAGRSGVTVGIRYYFLPGSDAGKHLIPLTIGVQF